MKISKIKKSYHSNLILDDISYDFPPNGIVAITGKSGCGKSTLLSIIGGFEKPDEGIVFKNEKSSFVFQDFHLIPYFSVEENIEIPLIFSNVDKKDRQEIILKCAREVGVESLLEKPVSTISQGEKARVAMARARAGNPEIIFLDEPTGSLDSSNATRLLNKLRELSKNILVIIVTHSLDEAEEYADIILHIENKKLVTIKDKKTIKSKTLEKTKRKKSRVTLIDLKNINSKSFKKRRGRIILGIIGVVLAFSLASLLTTFTLRLELLGEKMSTMYYDNSVVRITEIENIETDNDDLTIKKRIRPELSISNEWTSYFSYEYFFPTLQVITIDEKEVSINVNPVFNLNKSNTVVINEKLCQLLGDSCEKRVLNFAIDRNSSYYHLGKTVYDRTTFSLDFIVGDTFIDSVFYSSPTMYYSYDYLDEYLYHVNLANLSNEIGHQVSLAERIKVLAPKDDNVTSLELLLYYKNIGSKLPIDNEKYEYQSQAIVANKMILSLKDSTSLVFFLFVMLAISCSIILLSLMINSLLEDRKKEFAILRSLGSDEKSEKEMVDLENTHIAVIIAMSAVISNFFCCYVGDLILGIFSIPSFLFTTDVVAVKITCAIIVLSFIICRVALYFPYQYFKKKSSLAILKGD